LSTPTSALFSAWLIARSACSDIGAPGESLELSAKRLLRRLREVEEQMMRSVVILKALARSAGAGGVARGIVRRVGLDSIGGSDSRSYNTAAETPAFMRVVYP